MKQSKCPIIMEDPYEDTVIIVDPDSSTATAQDPDYVAPAPKTRVSTKWPIRIIISQLMRIGEMVSARLREMKQRS